MIIEASEEAQALCEVLGTRSASHILNAPGASSKEPSYLHMDGTAVFKFAVDIVPKCIKQVLEKGNTTMETIDFLVLHQANERIIDHVAKKMDIPQEKMFKNIASYGNMSSACIPIALDDMMEQGILEQGMRIICVGFGGGLTWGGVLIEIGGIQNEINRNSGDSIPSDTRRYGKYCHS